jgi:WD40 repeat protein
VHRIEHDDSVRDVTWSPDARFIATASRDHARLIDSETGEETHRLQHPGSIRAIAWNSDGLLVATASDDQTVRLFTTDTGVEIHRLPHRGAVRSVTWNTAGTLLATASEDGLACLQVFRAPDLLQLAARLYGDTTVSDEEQSSRRSTETDLHS